MKKPDIYIAFRFHGNFYHSYRGDTPDELGFGKDIRIIRHLIDTLDDLNQRGISKNLDYANKLEIPYVLFIGKQELKKNKLKLKNMNTGQETFLALQPLIKKLTAV